MGHRVDVGAMLHEKGQELRVADLMRQVWNQGADMRCGIGVWTPCFTSRDRSSGVPTCRGEGSKLEQSVNKQLEDENGMPVVG